MWTQFSLVREYILCHIFKLACLFVFIFSWRFINNHVHIKWSVSLRWKSNRIVWFDCLQIKFKILFILNFAVSSDIPSYLVKEYGYGSEEDPDAHQYTYNEFVKRGDEVNVSIRQQMIETLLKNATLYEKEPITNQIDQPNQSMVSCKVADECLSRLKKIYPMQKSVWSHILSKRSVILLGNTDYYPQLLYLPPVCDLIKVIFPIENWILAHYILKNVQMVHSSSDGTKRMYGWLWWPKSHYSRANESNDGGYLPYWYLLSWRSTTFFARLLEWLVRFKWSECKLMNNSLHFLQNKLVDKNDLTSM